jgi:hypothetical protein
LKPGTKKQAAETNPKIKCAYGGMSAIKKEANNSAIA